MSYFRELPNIEYLSFLSDRTSSDEYITVKNLFRKAKLRDDIIDPITVFDEYQIPDGYRPDNVAEELYGNEEYDWIVLISAGIVNVRNEWPISDQDLYRVSNEKYGSEINGIHHYETVEQRDSKGRVILDGKKIVSNILQIPIPSYTEELDLESFNIGINTTQYNVSSSLYAHDIITVKTKAEYGNFTINQDLNVGYGGTWKYQLDTNTIENLGDGTFKDTIEYIAEDGYLKIFSINNIVSAGNTTITVSIDSSESSYLTFYDSENSNYITTTNFIVPVTNYSYEIELNNKKRGIFVLKPIYLQSFIRDTRDIMEYKNSSQLVEDENGDDIIRVENIRNFIPFGSTFERSNPSEIEINLLQ